LKILSLREPWLSLILAGHKRVENRRWRTSYRGPLLLHASRTFDTDVPREMIARLIAQPYAEWEAATSFRTGGIVGMAQLVDCVHESPDPWHIKGQWGLILADVRRLSFIACRGQLGLFDPSSEILAAIQARVNEGNITSGIELPPSLRSTT
jgi:hypothetical protein